MRLLPIKWEPEEDDAAESEAEAASVRASFLKTTNASWRKRMKYFQKGSVWLRHWNTLLI